MHKRFLSDEAKQALSNAIKSVEARSSAEVVIAVRARAASYLHADLIAGIVAAIVTLAFLLFSSFEFPLWSFLVEPVIVGLVVGIAASRVPALRRLLTPERVRASWVERAAHATFFEKRVRQTRDRTGILVFIALTERRALVLIDTGVQDAVAGERWKAATAAIDEAIRNGADGLAVAARIEALGEILEPVLVHSADDVNELPDEVCGG